MGIENEYLIAEQFVVKLIQASDYPTEHPFNDYPRTPESMPVKMLIIIYAFTRNESIIKSYVKKCKSVEHGNFSAIKYNQEISELSWLYYLIVGAMEKGKICISNVFGEEKTIIDNGKKFEYAFFIDNPRCIAAFEVKTLTCDPFIKEEELAISDGKKLVKPFFPQLKDSEYLKNQSESIILTSSTYYYQMEQNIKRIAAKCKGSNVSGEKLYCFGVVFINASTSFEEFYSYLFNAKYGLFPIIHSSKIDALTLVSFDMRNDLKFDNLYRNGYVQTFVVHPSEELLKICQALRLDNYIAIGNEVNEDVLKKSRELYGSYKILHREGFVGIVPADASENEINESVSYLKGQDIR